jgi:hypothetical protein
MSDADRFDQSRKAIAGRVESTVRSCLADYYDVPEKRAVSTEHEREGAYETEGDYRATDLLDYAGVDWLIDEQPAIIPVGERIRPNKPQRRDFSLRLDNGADRPCESARIPAGLFNGLAPETYLFGWRSGESLDRAWLLDCRAFMQRLAAGVLNLDRRATGDGTVAGYISVADLAAAGIVLDSWEQPGGGD